MTAVEALGRLDWPTLQQIADTEASELARRLAAGGFTREEALRIVECFGSVLCLVRCGLTPEAAQDRAWELIEADEARKARGN